MPAFDAWIDMYAGEVFEQRVNEYIQLVDAACSTASSDTFNEMSNHFITACKLEYMFWDQALALKTWPHFDVI
jgi:thiaminase/transcriptional activator TenA